MTQFDLGYSPHDYVASRRAYRGTSLQAFNTKFPDDESCFLHIFERRFGTGPNCAKCGKACKWYRARGKRHFQNCCCGATVSPLAGTIFANTKLPLNLWFYAMLHLANTSEGLSAHFVARHLGIAYPNAFKLLQRLRTHLAMLDWGARVGGSGTNVFVQLVYLWHIRTPRKGQHDRAPVLIMADKFRVLSTVITKPRRHRLARIIAEKALPNSRIVTTCERTHRILARRQHRKELAEMSPEDCFEAFDGAGNINGFLANIRRPLNLQHGRPDRRHLWRYLKEFEFRYNRRRASQDIFWDMVSEFPDYDSGRAAQIESWNSRLEGPELANPF